MVAALVTTVAGYYFEQGCTISNYMGKLFFIFMLTKLEMVDLSPTEQAVQKPPVTET